MLYPQKLNQKKSNFLIHSLLLVSIMVALLVSLINRLTTPGIHWAAFVNAGIVYVWLTIMYAIRRGTNLAGHVLIQGIAISMLTIYMDYKLGFQGWSINLAVPIIIVIANMTMLILTIVSFKKYIRYALYQMMICIFSILPLFFLYEGIIQNKTMCYIASGISMVNLLVTLCLSAKDVKEAVIRQFHW